MRRVMTVTALCVAMVGCEEQRVAEPPAWPAEVVFEVEDAVECTAAVPEELDGLPMAHVAVDEGPCLVVLADRLVIRTYSDAAWDALRAAWPGVFVAEEEPLVFQDPESGEGRVVPSPDVVLAAQGDVSERTPRKLVRVDLEAARELLTDAPPPAVDVDGLAAVASSVELSTLVDLIMALDAYETGKVISVEPVVVAMDEGASVGTVEGALSDKTYNCSCLTDLDAEPPTYDALGASTSVKCDHLMKTSSDNLLLVDEATVYDTREGCFLGFCSGPPGNFHVFAIAPWQLPITCGGQFDQCAPPGSNHTYLRGDHESGGKCEWGGYDLPTSLKYERHGIYEWQTQSATEKAFLFLWEGDECKGWWIFTFCNDDDAIAIIDVERGDTLGTAELYRDEDYDNFGYGKPTVDLRLRTMSPCGIDAEVCDGEDDDCDGLVDEDIADAGEPCMPNTTDDVCTGGAWECRDGGMYCEGWTPATPEYCDGEDDDCDGQTDEDDPNLGGLCGSTLGVCAGEPGEILCEAGSLACQWSDASSDEICFDDIDQDCDGAADEAPCTFVPGTTRPCGSGIGICEQGVETFTDEGWGPCEGATSPDVERCGNDLDDDCDGHIDEPVCYCVDGDTRDCGIDAGACEAGTQQCVNGIWGGCFGAKPPNFAELCNAIDDDCDGSTDETCLCVPGTQQACGSSSVGVCTQGIQECSPDGIWGDCFGNVEPKQEGSPPVCDELDNDCDGEADEGCLCASGTFQTCSTEVGECTPGLVGCQNGQPTLCSGITPVDELCDGLDNDCDGATDEDFGCVCGTTKVCGTHVGECTKGLQLCEPVAGGKGGQWGACSGKPPKPEVCDYKDNDCNGQTDETVKNACGQCGPVPTEVCDYVDNDCDGGTDEGLKNACGQCGPVPAETCNAKDDDCDGKTDEGLSSCGLGIKCQEFCMEHTWETGQLQVALPPGDVHIPLIEFRTYEVGNEDDWAYQMSYYESAGVGYFPYAEKHAGGGPKACGRVCVLGLSGTVTGTWTSAKVANGQDKTLTVSPKTNGYTKTWVTFGMVHANWTGTDDDFQYFGGYPSSSSFQVVANGGNGNSFVLADAIQLALPWGYDLDIKPFDVSNGDEQTLTFDRDPGLDAFEIVSLTTYETCGDDDFNYKAQCSDGPGTTSCTIKGWNGSGCSRVAGNILLIQGEF